MKQKPNPWVMIIGAFIMAVMVIVSANSWYAVQSARLATQILVNTTQMGETP